MSNFTDYANFETIHSPRPYVNSLIRFHHTFTCKEREEAALSVGWNVFDFPPNMLLAGNLLSDSGTTTFTVEQLAKMIGTLGSETYGINPGYKKLLKTMGKIFGLMMDEWEIYLFHQGRAAENALFSQLKNVCGKTRYKHIIPSNGHFDTTAANIEENSMGAINLFSPDFLENRGTDFQGNMDVARLITILETKAEQVVLVYATITNNSAGGQPVSMENLRRIRETCGAHGKSFFLDVCRFAENAWFIHKHEPGYEHTPIREIVHEMFSLCDGFTISFKKDGLSTMGGALAIKRDSSLCATYPKLLGALRDHQILKEGYPAEGGITERDKFVIALGLERVVQKKYLSHRIELVRQFGEYLDHLCVPVLKPFGGHAVYIDIDRFFEGTELKREDFGGISLTGLLLLKGVRLCELGAFAFGKYDPKTGRETYPPRNFVRCAIPRNKYEIEDLYYVAECISELHSMSDTLPRAVPIYGRDLTLRHFKARFELVRK